MPRVARGDPVAWEDSLGNLRAIDLLMNKE